VKTVLAVAAKVKAEVAAAKAVAAKVAVAVEAELVRKHRRKVHSTLLD